MTAKRGLRSTAILCLVLLSVPRAAAPADPPGSTEPNVHGARARAVTDRDRCADYRETFQKIAKPAEQGESASSAEYTDGLRARFEKKPPPGFPVPASEPDSAGHSVHGPAFDEGPRGRAVLDAKMGRVHFPTSCRAEAQPFFDQGLAQFHGFLWYEAERSFREALELDPSCAIAVWGMALAAGGDIWTPQTTPRAKALAQKARTLRDEGKAKGVTFSATENAWIDAYAAYTADNSAASRRRYLDALRAAAQDGGTESRALLVFALLKNDDLYKPRGATFLDAPSPAYLTETDGLIEAILKREPNHPAHHYKIHLWDYVAPERALAAAEACGPSAPGIAHMWHMPGHLYFKLHRYAESLWHQEASARVDHDYLARARLMPFLNPTYVHNNGWLAETMLRVGRGRDAVHVARALLDLPRHPGFAGAETNAARVGWDRLLDALELTENWEGVRTLEREEPPYVPSTIEEETKWQRLRGVAAFQRHEAGGLSEAQARLQCLAGFASHSQKPAVERATRELAALKALAEGDRAVALKILHQLEREVPAPVPYYESRPGLGRSTLASYFASAGDLDRARQLAQVAVKEAPGEVLPLAHWIEILMAAGDIQAARPLYQELGRLARFADRDLPVFARLEKKMGEIPRVVAGLDWQDPRRHPALEKMGPLWWTPPPAEKFELTDADGKLRSSAEFQGKPTLVVFNLGGTCAHCNAQLAAVAKLGARFREAGVQVVVVSPEDPVSLGKMRSAFEKKGSPLEALLLSDPKHEVFRKFGAYDDFEKSALHASVLIGRQGTTLWRDVGSEPFTDLEKFLLPEMQRLLAVEKHQAPPK